MARPVSERVAALKRDLMGRIERGYLRPGDRFYSNRQLARQFGVSYQTADRLIRELRDAGALYRERGSGTYVSGRSQLPEAAELIFEERAWTPGSFGAYLLEQVEGRLGAAGLPYRVRRGGEGVRLQCRTYPVIWECEAAVERLIRMGGFGMLLNRRSPPGSSASFLDTVEIDDYSGGVLAGEAMRRQWRVERPGVFAGPRGDPRSRRRLEGFREVYPDADVVHSRSWHYEEALRRASRLLAFGGDGVFCANDRLAQAARLAYAAAGKPQPRLLGFDNAPIARREGLSSIAIPWLEFAEEVAGGIARRLAGDNGTARRVALAPRLLLR